MNKLIKILGLFEMIWFTIPLANAQITETIQIRNGIQCQTPKGKLQIEFISNDIARIRYTKEDNFTGNNTIVCIERPSVSIPYKLKQNSKTLRLFSPSLQIVVDKKTEAIEFLNKKGESILKEDKNSPRTSEKVTLEKTIYNTDKQHIEKTADGEKLRMETTRKDTTGHAWKYRQSFCWQNNEALYGLGSHMEDYMNLRGKTMYLCQHNLKAMVPVLVSTGGYGLLFDAGCGMIFCSSENKGYIEMEAVNEIDYYFMHGPKLDQVVDHYRKLTGASPMLPKYMFGYLQSKERYKTQEELTQTVKRYREQKIPLDVIVQDWLYWPKGWGGKTLDPKRYPNPDQMMKDIHAMNAKLMISIWPNITQCEEADSMQQKGFMIGNGVYNAYDSLARKAYWEHAYNGLFKYGTDAWWCDCTEPIDADWNGKKDFDPNDQALRWKKNLNALNDLLGATRASTFSLYHSQGIYENQRQCTSEKRVVNLTRSSYAGQQRYSTITWNGDTYASWKSFAQQIPSGLNFMATGCPYWTVDIGGFFTRKGNEWFRNGDFQTGVNDLGYRELYTRMFQFGVFLPVFRSHGTDTPREVWQFGNPGDLFYESLLESIRLRYRLLPYIYSLAGLTSHENYTMTRLLGFDFPSDTCTHDLKDEFMLGPSLLVCPVTQPMYYEANSEVLPETDKTRPVYLPLGANWINFWTGEVMEGGNTIVAPAPIDRIPLYVKAGSILPMGPVMQYTSEKPDAPYEIRIYPGADATFTLYEDEGDNYNYEQGKYSTIKLKWNDKKHQLTIDEREGSFPGMEKSRELKLVLVKENVGIGISEASEKNIIYKGEKQSVYLQP